jgi:hypothetical protein
MIELLVVVLFFLYAVLDAVALLPRVAGAYLQKNGLGYTFSVMVQTVKRVFVVSYPPLLGWLSARGGDLYNTIYLSYLAGVLGVMGVLVWRFALIRRFMVWIDGYALNGSMVHAVFKYRAPARVFSDMKIDEDAFKWNGALVFSSSWVYFVYGTALFFINLFGAKFHEHSAVIYQLVGIINALGTLLMSFYLDPKISRNFDSQSEVMVSNDSVVAGQLLALAVWGPLAIFLFSLWV